MAVSTDAETVELASTSSFGREVVSGSSIPGAGTFDGFQINPIPNYI